MSDENKCTERKDHDCIIKCECFRKFLIVALGTFVGVFFALTLFAATHKPPIDCAENKPQPQVVINQVPPQPPKAVENPFKNPNKHFKHHEKGNHQ